MIMNKNILVMIYIIAMVVTVTTIDIVFFRHRFWERLFANIGIIMIYVAFYLAFVKNR